MVLCEDGGPFRSSKTKGRPGWRPFSFWRVDLCSGDGWFTLQIAKVARHVAAIDIDPTLLEVARLRLMEAGVTNCSLIAGDAYGITSLWPESVDLVFMANAFHGVADPARLAMAVKAALKRREGSS